MILRIYSPFHSTLSRPHINFVLTFRSIRVPPLKISCLFKQKRRYEHIALFNLSFHATISLRCRVDFFVRNLHRDFSAKILRCAKAFDGGSSSILFRIVLRVPSAEIRHLHPSIAFSEVFNSHRQFTLLNAEYFPSIPNFDGGHVA